MNQKQTWVRDKLKQARTAGDEHGHVEGLHEAHGLGVPRDAQIEAAQPVRRQRVRACVIMPTLRVFGTLKCLSHV